MSRTVIIMILMSIVAVSCGGDEPSTAPPADDRGMYASASGIRICGATTGGVAAAATDLGQAAADADTDRVRSLAATLQNQGQQLASTSRSGAAALAEHAASDAAQGTKEQGLDLYDRCATLGDDAVALAELATTASADALADVSASASDLAALAETVGSEVEGYASELPHP